MSTFYKLRCVVCGKTGGFFSRQVWGYGNADIVDTFKFMMLHTSTCQPEFESLHLEVVSEHDEEYLANEEADEAALKKDAADMFPRSGDWAKMCKYPLDKSIGPAKWWAENEAGGEG